MALAPHTAVAVAACPLALLAAVPALRRRDHARAVQVASQLLLAGAVLAVLAATLLGTSSGQRSLNLVPGAGIAGSFDSTRGAAGNIAGNVALFVPLGFLTVTALRRRPLAVALLGAALSVVIEAVQFVSAQRWADIDDVLLNTLGAVLGAVAALAVVRLVNQARPRPLRVARGGTSTEA